MKKFIILSVVGVVVIFCAFITPAQNVSDLRNQTPLNVDLALYAGSLASDIAVTTGSESEFKEIGGRQAIFAFDGCYDAASYDRVDYATIYGADKVPTRGRTFWQTDGNYPFGEIPNGRVPGRERVWIMLDYSKTSTGSVTFDKIVLYSHYWKVSGDVKKYTIEISDDNKWWVKVVKADDTQTLPKYNIPVTHQLAKPVTARYVRYVCVDKTSEDTNKSGLTSFQLYRTK